MEGRFQRAAGFSLGQWLRDFLRPGYLSLGISLFIAMYVGMKFILILFNATDAGERWSFELTLFAELNLPDIQLAFLASVAAATNAFLHSSVKRSHRAGAILVTASMVGGLVFALRGASADLDPANVGRLAALALLLGMVILDNIHLARSAPRGTEDFIAAELRAIAERADANGATTPAEVVGALRELEALVQGLPGTGFPPSSAQAPAGSPEDEGIRDLITSLYREAPKEGSPESPKPKVPRGTARTHAGASWAEEATTIDKRTGFLRGRLIRSSAVLMNEARMLMDRGALEAALKRLDKAAARDERYPGLWALAAEVYDRLGKVQAAAECRRREAAASRMRRTRRLP